MRVLQLLNLCLLITFRFSAWADISLTDSLKQSLKTSGQKDEIYLQLCRIYMPDSIELVEFYANKALEESRINGNKPNEAKALHQIAIALQYRGNLEKAMQYYKLALAIRTNLPPDNDLLNTINNLGSVYQLMGDNHLAMEYYLKALELGEKLDDKIAIAKTYNNLGIISKEMNQYDKALQYLMKSLQISESLNNLGNMAYSLNNIGLIYKLQGNYQEALKYMNRSIEVKKTMGNQRGIASTLNNIGNIYLLQDQTDKALKNFEDALVLQIKTLDSVNMIPTFINFSSAYSQQKNIPKAIDYLEKASDLAKKLKQQQSRRQIYQALADLYAQQKKYYLAYSNQLEYSKLSDSLNLSNMNNAVAQLQVKFETREKEKENETLKQHNEIQQNQLRRIRINLMIAGISLIFIITLAVFLLRSYYVNKRINRLLKEKNRFIEQFNAELNTLNDDLETRINERTQKLQEEITHRIEAEKLIKDALTKAEKANALKEAFLANISHEIRTPLNGIMGFANLLKSQDTTPEQQAGYLETIVNCSRQLLAIINDIIEISKIDSGQIKVIESPCSLSQILNDTYYLVQTELTKKNKHHIEIKRPATKQVEYFFLADYEKIQNIFRKLINNAVKFTSFGFIEYGFHIENNNRFITFFVKDTGIGISEEEQKFIFDHFTQADNSLTRIYGGTGLGLSICKGLVELMEGTIKIESEKDKGTTISFSIPIQNLSNEPFNTTNRFDSKLNWSGKNILIAESDQQNQHILIDILTPTQINILTASDGEATVEMAKMHPEIDLIMMDIDLPKLNGYDATRQVKQILPKTIIIALTANSLSTDKVRCIEAGCDNYISKPVQQEKLIALIKPYLA